MQDALFLIFRTMDEIQTLGMGQDDCPLFISGPLSWFHNVLNPELSIKKQIYRVEN
jgi:hypothetical protein